jgi:hypothetical protein
MGGEFNYVHGLEGYTRQLLSDFVRILFLANKPVFGGKAVLDVQIKYISKSSSLW